MLTITETAAEAIDSIVKSTPEAPESVGLRIAPAARENGAPGFTLVLAGEPEPDDQVVEGTGEVPVFVAAESAEELDDKVLDAQVQGDQVGFILAQR